AARMSSAGVASYARAPPFSGADRTARFAGLHAARAAKPFKGARMQKLAALALAFLAATIASAPAQTSRPVTIVVPFPAGGPTGPLARILADRMRRLLDQSVIVDNPTGAGGTIGTGRVARAAPDGSTIILGHWQTHVVNGATYSLAFDVVKDFEPISLVAECTGGLDGNERLTQMARYKWV